MATELVSVRPKEGAKERGDMRTLRRRQRPRASNFLDTLEGGGGAEGIGGTGITNHMGLISTNNWVCTGISSQIRTKLCDWAV